MGHSRQGERKQQQGRALAEVFCTGADSLFCCHTPILFETLFAINRKGETD